MGYEGKTHVLPPLFVCHLLSHPTLSTSLMLQLVVEAVNAFGSGVAGLSVLCPPSHSTHVCPFFSLTQEIGFNPRFCCFSPHAQVLGGRFLVPRRFSSSPPRVAEHPRTANSSPSCCLCTHGQKRSCFSSRRASIVYSFPCWIKLFFPRTGIILFGAHIVS